MAAVYELGFNVLHSDMDVTWFASPLPFFQRYKDTLPHAFFTSDMTTSKNAVGGQWGGRSGAVGWWRRGGGGRCRGRGNGGSAVGCWALDGVVARVLSEACSQAGDTALKC